MGKNILITPGDALINFSGTSAGNINQIVQDDGRVSFIGISSGAEQLTISDSLSGSVFTVNNSLGSPIIDVDFDNTITIPNGASDGYIFTSDSGGTATWQASPGLTSGSCIDTLWTSSISGCSPVDIGPEVNIDGKLNIATISRGTSLYNLGIDSAGFVVTGVTGGGGNIFVNKTTYVDALNGNDSTGVRGDMSLPYITISGANQTAITGDTVHVRPGTYPENDIIKDGVAYYFDKGAIIHPSEATQVSDNKAIIDIDGYTHKAYVLGYGEFISDNNDDNADLWVGCIHVDSDEAYIEFDTAYMRASSPIGGLRGTLNIQQTGTEDQEIFIKGLVKKDNTQGGSSQVGMIVKGGNIRFEGKIIQNGTGSESYGLYISSDVSNFKGTGDIFCDGDTADSYSFLNSTRGNSIWDGNIVAGNPATCYAYKISSTGNGESTFFGKITGAIWLNLGGTSGMGSYISGTQQCSNSPNNFAITCNESAPGISLNVIDLKITSSISIFNIVNGSTLFQGTMGVTNDNIPFITQSGGKFVFNGNSSDIAKRLTASPITGGECVIQSDFESWGHNSAGYVFKVDGGTLRVNGCKIENHTHVASSGVIDYVSGQLILNGAVLVSDPMDATNYSIKTPTAGVADVVIYGDSYSNKPVGPGTIHNTVPNGGFLYPITGCTTVRKYCDWNISGKTTTTNFQMTSGATDGYILTSDVSGNASWQPSIDGNTFVTGFTYDNINTFTISDNDGSTFSASINVLSATTISATTFYGDGSNLTGIGNTSGDCISQLWVSTISGCSPVTIGPEVNIDGPLTVEGAATFESSGGDTTFNDGTEFNAGAAFDVGDFTMGTAGRFSYGEWIDSQEEPSINVDSKNIIKLVPALRSPTGWTVTTIHHALEGQQLILLADPTMGPTGVRVTIQDNANINLNGTTDFIMNSGDTLTLVALTTNTWYETSRMVR